MKIGQIYDLAAFQRFLDSSKKTGFADSDGGVILARSLTAIDPTIFEKKFPELTFNNSGIDVNNTGGYAQRIQSKRLVARGSFTESGDTSGNKGKISLAGEDNFLKVVERAAFSSWSDTEIKQAEIENVNLPSEYITNHNMIYQREIDEIGYLGVRGQEGLLNYSGFVSSGATGAIGTLTAQQMYDDIADLIEAQWNAVNNTPEYKANRVDMPTYVLNKLTSTILDTAAGSGSVLNALKANFAGVEFRSTFRADNAGGVGVSHTAAYTNNKEGLIMRIPQALTIGEIIKPSSFDFRVDSKYRIGGLDVLDDTSGHILTGL